MRSHRLLLVFARLPRDEQRMKPLVPGAPGPRVEAVHRALLLRTLEVAGGCGADVRLVTTGEVPASLARGGVEIARQVGASFAERLEQAVAGGFRDGWRQVVVVGGDTPDLDASHLRAAFDALDGGAQAVLGPSTDGGFYLLGLDRFSAAPFRHGALCTPEACAATRDALVADGFAVARLTTLVDVDVESDLRRLAARPGALGRLAALLLARAASPFSDEETGRTIFFAAIRPRGPPVLVPTRI